MSVFVLLSPSPSASSANLEGDFLRQGLYISAAAVINSQMVWPVWGSHRGYIANCIHY